MEGFTGTARLLRLALRRDRLVLPAWVMGMAAFLAATTALFADSYGSHPELLVPDSTLVVENPGMRVLGLVTGASVGAYTLHRDGLTLAVLAAMMSVLAVVRHTRQTEELGREELLAAGVVGRHASLTAAVLVTLAANLVLVPALAVAMVVAGQPVAGSLAAGASVALVGVAFTGVAAVAAQLLSTSRGAVGLSGAVLGAAFALSALGNMMGTVEPDALRVTSAWPAWLSPIGWGQQMRPFADDLWWPVGLAAGSAAVLVAVAVALAHRRDVGRGILAERRGPAHASRSLRSPEGVVWRLQRGALAGWAAGMAGFGLVFGALADRIGGLEGSATEWYEAFGGDADLLGAYWASMMQFAGVAVSMQVVSLLLRLRHDETAGTLEPVLGTAVSRARWLAAYAVNALAGATLLMLVFGGAVALAAGRVLGDAVGLLGDLLPAAALQLPAIAVLGAAVVAVVAVLPRWSVGAGWLLVVVTVAVGPMFGPSLGLPTWLLDLSPFTHVPNAPAVPVDAAPVLLLVLAAALVGGAGTLALRRRDLLLPV